MTEHQLEPFDRELLQQIDPSRCRPWRFHNRSIAWLSTTDQRSLELSIAQDGQQQPGLVRKLDGDPDCDYELVFGMRRCAACASTGRSFLAKVLPPETPDQDCVRFMHVENEERATVSELERAKNYRALISGGVFLEQNDLAIAIGLSKGRVSQMLKAAEVFDYPWLAELIEPGLMSITVRDATQLARALSKTERQRLMRDRAKRLVEQTEPLDPKEMVRQLLAGAGSHKGTIARREVLARVGRRPVAEISHTKAGDVQVSISKVDRSPEETDALIRQIESKVRSFLTSEPLTKLG